MSRGGVRADKPTWNVVVGGCVENRKLENGQGDTLLCLQALKSWGLDKHNSSSRYVLPNVVI
ncbi:hypothetical protein TSUD_56750 [Trifolium subterraneum]|uniref:Uncharacterized protein n=1 Tax=Trifolium subterraneum TaxID=3900 RepID=A0A2Z6P6J3_TRISU|nr:hypothetical protein TSUD_56750 [Trifolium subterraneum]